MPANGIRGSREQEARVRLPENGGVVGSRYGKAQAKSRQKGPKKSTVVTEGMLEAERANLIAEKQGRLETVLDSHDDLVRELFHMENFIMMLGYDPSEAKSDTTQVFQNYKAKFDLVEKAVPGSSRPTRRSRTQQVQSLKAASISAPLPISALSLKKRVKIKTTTATADRSEATQVKGKAHAVDHVLESRGVSVFNDEQPGDVLGESISAVLVHRNPRRANDEDVRKTSPPAKRRKLTSNGVGESVPSVSRRSGRLKGPISAPDVPLIDPHECDHHTTQSAAPPFSQRQNVKEAKPITISAPPAAPKFNVKRVKLIIRRPPPPITNPRQRPPPAQYNSSVNAFLSSYITLNDQDVDESTLQRQVQTDAIIFERAERSRKKGYEPPDSDVPIDFDFGSKSYITPQRIAKDRWDHVIEDACRLGQLWARQTLGPHIAGQIAKSVRAYWDGQESKKEKLRLLEERRLRGLAKATIRMVTDEWKKAVFYIREQERQKLEAEEVQRGRDHLDAILDQSGQLLETQQGDLTRGEISRSRSSSMSLTYQGWGSEDEEDEDEEESVDAADDEDSDDGAGDEGMDEGKEGLDGTQTEETDQARSPSHLDADIPSDVEDDTHTHMLLDSLDVPQAPAGVHPSTSEDLLETETSQLSLDRHLPDEGDQSDGSSIFAVDEFINAAPSSPPQRPQRPSPLHSEAAMPQPTNVISETPIKLGSPLSRTPASEPDSQSASLEWQTPPLQTSSPSYQSLPQLVDDYASSDQEGPSEANLEQDTPEPCPPSTPPASDPPINLSNHDSHSSPLHSPSFASISQVDVGRPTLSSGGKTPEADSVPSNLYSLNSDTRSSSSSPPPHQEEEGPESGHQTLIEAASEMHSDSDQDTGTKTPSVFEAHQDEIAVPAYLKPFAVAPVEWVPDAKVVPPLLLRGVLRPYQQSGLEWLASLHTNNLNGILADEMGLGKTIQTIALLAHLACDRGIWGPHLIVVPTSVLLNWEMEFKKFLPGFKVLSYHGSTKRRKELRQGWNDRHHFNVCITSYTLASRDAHIFKRKAWYYMILDEAHMIKNFKSQRWNILLMFRSFRRLLLTGTPLQNNLTELWALLQFLMSGANFASLKDFGDWFSNPLEKAIEMGNALDDDTMQRVSKLHTVLRPYLLRRLKRDVEKELPSKYEHLVLCPLSKRQRFLYDEFMSRAHTRDALQSGVYQKIANILMQLRKVCNHPDLFEVRPIVTSFAMERSAVADFEIKELLVRQRWIEGAEDDVNLGALGLRFIDNQDQPFITALETRRLDATSLLPFVSESPGEPPPKDTRTIEGFRKHSAYLQRASTIARWSHIGYLNRLRCSTRPIYSSELLALASRFHEPIMPVSSFNSRRPNWEAVSVVNAMVKSYETRAEEMASVVDRFAFLTPAVVALDLPRITFSGCEAPLLDQPVTFDNVLHKASVKLQIAFPDPSLLQYDCGKLQELTRLLREKKAGGHRVLIFTQMTKILDILEIFLSFHGYLYLRLDGATKIEDRQYITERFNADPRIFCFIASSRSGGVGINLTGADTVVFYDSDFNPQMDRQCEDRAHRIGQIRDVHIYRFVSQHTVEEALLRKANQKRSLDELVIQKGEFDWRSLFNDESALSKALEEFEDREDVHAAAVAATEEVVMQGADEADFAGDMGEPVVSSRTGEGPQEVDTPPLPSAGGAVPDDGYELEDDVEEGGSVAEYMIAVVQRDYEFFREWRL
ncbi:SNF2 family N-terminal domain-containing protein [Lyophyllum atratum]|nr:SNF2 family N-terminal domain-containing protein [Lyophyllum atratum]